MTTHTICVAKLHSEQAANYFTRADRRVMIGLRATLEILGLPLPDYARRRYSGPTPAAAVMTAYRADHPARLNYTLTPRKPNASADLRP